MKNLFFVLICLLVLISCGGKKSTQTTFKLNKVVGAFSQGGLVLFGKNESVNGEYVIKNIIDPNVELDLVNGNWSFVIVAWDGVENMTGNNKCAKVDNIQLGGGEVTIPMTLSKQGCQGGEFFGEKFFQNDIGQFNQFRVIDCQNPEAMKNVDENNYGKECIKGGTRSFRVVIPEYVDGVPSVATGFKSKCVDMQDNGYGIAPLKDSVVTVPIVKTDPSDPIRILIESFTGTGCNGAVEVIDTKTHYNQKIKLTLGGANKTVAVLKTNYCRGIHLSQDHALNDVEYDGTNTLHIACSKQQLLDILRDTGTNPTYNAFSFALGRSIDLGTEELGTETHAGPQFIFGNGHSIHNFKLTNSNTSFIGLFGDFPSASIIKNLAVEDVTVDVSGSANTNLGVLSSGITSSGVKIENITMRDIHLTLDGTIDFVGTVVASVDGGVLNDITVEDSSITVSGTSTIDEIGFVAGKTGGAPSLFSNITVARSSIVSDSVSSFTSKVGSVLGKSYVADFFKGIEVNNMLIELEGSTASAVGGVVGESNHEVMANVSVQGLIKQNEPGTTHNNYGGLIGKLGGPNQRKVELVFSNVDLTLQNTADVGGIIGGQIGGLVNNAYYEGNIVSTNNGFCGGITGNISGAGHIYRSETHGSIMCGTGNSGGIVGKASANTAGILKLEFLYSDMSLQSSTNQVAGLVGEGINSAGTIELKHGIFQGSFPASGNPKYIFFGGCDNAGVCSIENVASSYAYPVAVTTYENTFTITTTGCFVKDHINTTEESCAKIPGEPLQNLDGAITGIPRNDWDGGSYAFFFTYANDFLDGNGSQKDPFTISSPLVWSFISNMMAAEAGLSPYSKSSFVLTGPLDFSSGGFKPWLEFSGTFFGNGQTISNINYDESASAGDENLGIFRKLIGKFVINPRPIDSLNLVNINFVQDPDASMSGLLAGEVVIGAGDSVLVANVNIEDSSISSSGAAVHAVGGLFGKLSDASSEPIRHITNIKVKNSNVSAGTNSNIGGVIGESNGAFFSKIYVDDFTSISGGASSGGIVGNVASANITNFVVSASVNGTSAGGIAGTDGGSGIFRHGSIYSNITGPTKGAGIGATSSGSSLDFVVMDADTPLPSIGAGGLATETGSYNTITSFTAPQLLDETHHLTNLSNLPSIGLYMRSGQTPGFRLEEFIKSP